MSLANLFHFLSAQHVSDIDISIIRSLRLCCWITTSVVLFSVRCVLELWCGWFWVVFVFQAEAETCWAHNKWNKIASGNKLVFHSSTITMMHGPINISTWGKSGELGFKPVTSEIMTSTSLDDSEIKHSQLRGSDSVYLLFW